MKHERLNGWRSNLTSAAITCWLWRARLQITIDQCTALGALFTRPLIGFVLPTDVHCLRLEPGARRAHGSKCGGGRRLIIISTQLPDRDSMPSHTFLLIAAFFCRFLSPLSSFLHTTLLGRIFPSQPSSSVFPYCGHCLGAIKCFGTSTIFV